VSDLYTSTFYDKWAKISRKSAEIVVPLVLDLVPAKSVIDVGCGEGHWLRVFKNHGATDVLGLDGEYVPHGKDRHEFYACDLAQPFYLNQKCDLAVSLEVAEHLPIERAESFVDDLAKLAPVVLFSAAIPGQEGTGHVNCQWPSWWAEHFAARDFLAYDPIRPQIWDNNDVAWWYRQNILMFSSNVIGRYPETLAGPDIDRVHPQHWRERVRVWT
jgi:SAM-dependent methyltransferase